MAPGHEGPGSGAVSPPEEEGRADAALPLRKVDLEVENRW